MGRLGSSGSSSRQVPAGAIQILDGSLRRGECADGVGRCRPPAARRVALRREQGHGYDHRGAFDLVAELARWAQAFGAAVGSGRSASQAALAPSPPPNGPAGRPGSAGSASDPATAAHRQGPDAGCGRPADWHPLVRLWRADHRCRAIGDGQLTEDTKQILYRDPDAEAAALGGWWRRGSATATNTPSAKAKTPAVRPVSIACRCQSCRRSSPS